MAMEMNITFGESNKVSLKVFKHQFYFFGRLIDVMQGEHANTHIGPNGKSPKIHGSKVILGAKKKGDTSFTGIVVDIDNLRFDVIDKWNLKKGIKSDFYSIEKTGHEANTPDVIDEQRL